MMLVHFKETFPFRVAEWIMSVIMIGWGIVLFHPDFNAAASPWGSSLFGTVSPYIFGLSCLAVGLFRFMALTINGLWWRTPFIRLCMAFLANYLWVQICFGLLRGEGISTGFAVYPVFVAVEFYNAFRAADDSRKSWANVASGVRNVRSRKAA